MYFFDLDGTLLDSNGVWLEIDISFLGRYGIDPVPQDYTDYVTRHSPLEAAEHTRQRFALPQTAQEILAQWHQMAQRAYGGGLALKPGARTLLEGLREAGAELGLLTSCMPQLCQLALEHHGLTGWFSHVLTTEGLGLQKKDPELYLRAAQLCGRTPEECTFFDDSPVYCAAARAAGMTVVGVYDPLFHHRQEELRTVCHHYLEDLLGGGDMA